MKTKLILTGLCLLFGWGLAAFYRLFESPIAGSANAQLLTDSIPAYGWHRFIASDGIPTTIFILQVIVLACIWLLPLFKTKKP